MIAKYLSILLVTIAFVSCNKHDEAVSETYNVSAKKLITIKTNNRNYAETELSNKAGYQYNSIPPMPNYHVVAQMNLPAIDDSNRIINGKLQVEISSYDSVANISFVVHNITQANAYAMFLNYHSQTLNNITGISSSLGQLVELNGNGSNNTVSALLPRIINGDPVSQLGTTYYSSMGEYVILVFREIDGSYGFSYSCSS